MEFVSAINHSHDDMRGVSDFLCEHFEFTMIYHDSSSITVNNGLLSIRFMHNDNIKPSVNLDLESTDIAAGSERLITLGLNPLTEIIDSDMFRKEQQFEGPYGLHINLHQVLTEDDLGIHPELNKTLDWEPKAEEMAKSILTHVTIHFRNPARKKMVQQAEAFALIEGNLHVTKDDMISAFLYTTPYFKQDDLQKILIDNGISQEFIDEQIKNM